MELINVIVLQGGVKEATWPICKMGSFVMVNGGFADFWILRFFNGIIGKLMRV